MTSSISVDSINRAIFWTRVVGATRQSECTPASRCSPAQPHCTNKSLQNRSRRPPSRWPVRRKPQLDSIRSPYNSTLCASICPYYSHRTRRKCSPPAATDPRPRSPPSPAASAPRDHRNHLIPGQSQDQGSCRMNVLWCGKLKMSNLIARCGFKAKFNAASPRLTRSNHYEIVHQAEASAGD